MQPGILAAGAFFSAVFTFLVFSTALENQFVALDDLGYIVNNSHIEKLDWNTVVWAFSSFHEGNWHPVTMLSLALDRFVWGLDPTGFHLTNAAIHSCTVFCSCFLFSLLLKCIYQHEPGSGTVPSSDQATPGRDISLNGPSIALGSISAALFFGLHPLRVESVVWASERKDVLCMFFLVTSLWMYVRYAVKRRLDSAAPPWSYPEFIYALILAALAQMSKPTAVSLPLILVISDWYPLDRVTGRSSLLRSLLEKAPFFILSGIGVVMTLFAQQVAMKYAPHVGVASRLLVACKALLFYIVETLWPSGLTAFYMHPGNVAESALPEYLLYALLVLAISLAAICCGKRQHVWTALWLYYVVTIAPMLGLIQVGGQWAADRYSYLPSLGFSLLWGGWVANRCGTLARGERSPAARVCLAIAACQLLFYTAQTLRQIPVWRTTETLASRIIDQMPHMSGAPYLARAIYRNETGQYQQALEDVGEAMKISLRRGLTSTYTEIAFQQAIILKNLGRIAEALTIIEWGIQTSVGPPPAAVMRLRDDLALLAADSSSGKQR